MDKPLIDVLWVASCAGLVFLMQAGFLCLESGLTRSKNSINVALKNLTDFGIAVVLYWAFGFALMFGSTQGGWIGTTHFFTPVGQGGMWLAAFFLFQLMFCGTSATIVSGAVAERIRFAAYMIETIILAGLVYPRASKSDFGRFPVFGFRISEPLLAFLIGRLLPGACAHLAASAEDRRLLCNYLIY